jgi:ABC-type uncharacterized transport system permease subunit
MHYFIRAHRFLLGWMELHLDHYSLRAMQDTPVLVPVITLELKVTIMSKSNINLATTSSVLVRWQKHTIRKYFQAILLKIDLVTQLTLIRSSHGRNEQGLKVKS